jgi:hypothetical protein
MRPLGDEPTVEGGLVSTKKRVAKGVAFVAGLGLGSAALPLARSDADNVNMSWTLLAHVGDQCIHGKAEIDHDTAEHHRYWWALINRYDEPSGSSCLWKTAAYSRIKGESYRADVGGSVYALCLGTIGDGLGDPGYVHANYSEWGLNSPWIDGGECGAGDYRAKTYAHRQNNGWMGGEITNFTAHSFK